MKPRLIGFLCVGVLLTAAVEHVQAVGYRIEYAGSFVSILNPDGSAGGSFSPGKGVAIGDTFTGTFTLDTDDAMPDTSGEDSGGSNVSVFVFELGSVFPTLTLNGTENVSLKPKIGLAVLDNVDDPPDPLFAGYFRELGIEPLPTSADAMFLFTPESGFDIVTSTGFEVEFITIDLTASVLSSTAIPDPLVLLEHSFLTFQEYVNGELHAVGFGAITSASISLTLDPITAILPILQLLLLDEASSIDYWVDSSNGSDVSPGTKDKPFKTITKALGLVTTGRTVNVAPGSYDLANGEVFPLQLPAGAILNGDESNKGAGTPPTVIKGGSPTGHIGTSIEAGANSVIAGFTILHDDAGATANMNIAITNDGITLRNNHVIDGGRNGIYIYAGASNHVIAGNIIQGNSGVGLGFIGGGIGSRVEDNLITGNSGGVEYDSPGGDMGGGATGSTGGNIISCNNRNDLWTNSGVTIDAQNNLWDHVPPTVSDGAGGGIDIRRDLASTVITTGAMLAPSPCP
jgi:hypothetical protein